MGLECRPGDRVVLGSNPASELWQLPHFTIYIRVSSGGDTIRPLVPSIELVSMPGKVKYPTKGLNV